MTASNPTSSHAAATAAHRFGLGEATLAAAGADPRSWLRAQIGPASAQRGSGLASGVEGLQRFAEYQRMQQQLRRRAPAARGSAARGVRSSSGTSRDDVHPVDAATSDP